MRVFFIIFFPAHVFIKVGHALVGTLWFAIFLQLFLILGVLYTLASDSIAMHRFQIAVFGSIAVVFAVEGVNAGIFAGAAALNAMSAGWLVLAFVNILWVLYFTSEEDSLALHLFNTLGTGGLTPPGRRRRRTQSTMHNKGPTNGYVNNYESGIGPHDIPYDTRIADTRIGDVRSQHSFVGGASLNENSTANRSVAAPSIQNVDATIGDGASNRPKSPLVMGSTGSAAGNSVVVPGSDVPPQPDAYQYKAKAMYACMSISYPFRITNLKCFV